MGVSYNLDLPVNATNFRKQRNGEERENEGRSVMDGEGIIVQLWTVLWGQANKQMMSQGEK